MRRARGFTLTELMISMGLAGIVVAGALQMHRTFTTQSSRQQQIADTQQTLRVAMQILERAIRSAGAGMVGGRMVVNTCGGPRTYTGFGWSNLNAFPQTTYDSSVGGNDNDPDWFRVITAESDTNVATADTGTTATVFGSTAAWSAGDLMLVVKPTTTVPNHCVREITSVTGLPPNNVAHTGSLHYPCANDPPDCLAGTVWPAPVRRFRTETIYRVLPGTGADPPRLAMRRARIGDVASDDWEIFVEDIEDMQIAVILKNGLVCNDRDDPALCDPTQAAAVRLTLVARMSSPVGSGPPSYQGGYEDRPAVLVQDGLARRSLTAEIQLRN